MAKAILVEPGNYSSFLNGKRGISAESACLLLKWVNMPTSQAVAAFSKPTSTSRILKLQQFKNGLHLDNSGWTSREGGTDDPVDSTPIDATPTANEDYTIRSVIAAIANLSPLRRQIAIDAIAKSFPNPNGTTAASGQRFSR